MQLTQFTDIALRVLMYLGKKNDQRQSLITIAELAEQFQVSHNHLIKIVNQLVKLGWIEGIRGRSGGLQLAHTAQLLRLGDIISTLEDDKNLVDCSKNACVLNGNCRLQGILSLVLQQFFQGLNHYTLADLIREPTSAVLVQMHQRWDGN